MAQRHMLVGPRHRSVLEECPRFAGSRGFRGVIEVIVKQQQYLGYVLVLILHSPQQHQYKFGLPRKVFRHVCVERREGVIVAGQQCQFTKGKAIEKELAKCFFEGWQMQEGLLMDFANELSVNVLQAIKVSGDCKLFKECLNERRNHVQVEVLEECIHKGSHAMAESEELDIVLALGFAPHFLQLDLDTTDLKEEAKYLLIHCQVGWIYEEGCGPTRFVH
mgnify:CR=1 FL=1